MQGSVVDALLVAEASSNRRRATSSDATTAGYILEQQCARDLDVAAPQGSVTVHAFFTVHAWP